MNAVMAMQLGGDDFIAKPFDLTVLTAKIQALLPPELRFFRTCQPASLRPSLSEHR